MLQDRNLAARSLRAGLHCSEPRASPETMPVSVTRAGRQGTAIGAQEPWGHPIWHVESLLLELLHAAPSLVTALGSHKLQAHQHLTQYLYCSSNSTESRATMTVSTFTDFKAAVLALRIGFWGSFFQLHYQARSWNDIIAARLVISSNLQRHTCSTLALRFRPKGTRRRWNMPERRAELFPSLTRHRNCWVSRPTELNGSKKRRSSMSDSGETSLMARTLARKTCCDPVVLSFLRIPSHSKFESLPLEIITVKWRPARR